MCRADGNGGSGTRVCPISLLGLSAMGASRPTGVGGELVKGRAMGKD